jgi:outer membrane lipoprotein SlyB
MKSLLLTSVIITSLIASGCSSLNRTAHIGEVVSSTPMPTKCRKDSPNLFKVIAYTAVGVAVGNQFGGGKGKKVMQGIGGATGLLASTSGHDSKKQICEVPGYFTKVKYSDQMTLRNTVVMIKTDKMQSRGTRIEFTLPSKK